MGVSGALGLAARLAPAFALVDRRPAHVTAMSLAVAAWFVIVVLLGVRLRRAPRARLVVPATAALLLPGVLAAVPPVLRVANARWDDSPAEARVVVLERCAPRGDGARITLRGLRPGEGPREVELPAAPSDLCGHDRAEVVLRRGALHWAWLEAVRVAP